MIIQCQSCSSKYFLPEEKVPANALKVRCPKCRAVFMLAGKPERVAVVAAPVEAAVESPRTVPQPSIAQPLRSTIAESLRPTPTPVAAPEPTGTPVTATGGAAPAAVAEPEVVEPLAAAPHVADTVPAGKSAPRGGKSADDRARRLARVLVSDILWYNRDRRDAALRDGTLMTSLSEEIKKSWELYKEKVGPDAAHSTNYFKEALNEILADGQQVF